MKLKNTYCLKVYYSKFSNFSYSTPMKIKKCSKYTKLHNKRDGNLKELSVSLGFLKDVKVDDTLIQQIVEKSIKKVSETANVTINEEDITK